MKASIVATLSVGFASIPFCGGFTYWVPHTNAAALSHLALHSTQVSSVQETTRATDNNKKVRLLKQAENYLGSSNLVYVYAELRQLSYCGYTKIEFGEVDCNQNTPVSNYKLLDILLKERDWVIKRTLDPKTGEEWRSNRSLKATLEELLDVEPPDNPDGAKDLESLKEQIRKIGIGALEEEAADKFLGLIGKGSTNRTPNDSSSSDMIEKGARGALKKILNHPTKVALITDTGDERIIELIKGFSGNYLRNESGMINVFKEYSELIYFSDRYPGKECVYCITLYPGRKIVEVTFRGSVNLNDWFENSQVIQKEVENPAKVQGDGSGQPDKIGLHNGFHDFLLRKRLDKIEEDGNPATKFDRIVNRVKPFCKDGWTLGVTGHSLGAALATLFGFYAAMDQRILQNGKPVEVFSFASPFVGDHRFRTAFKLLEGEGKIVHARIVNNHDFVPMLPFISPKVDLEQKLTFESWDFSWYKHVGLQIFLAQPEANKAAFVDYPIKEGVFALAASLWQSNIVSSAPLLLEAGTSHSLAEYQSRIETAIQQETGANKLDATLVEYYGRNIIATSQ